MASIYDVARVAGVSPATVSRAFARPSRVHEATLAKIRAAAEEVGYRVKSISQPEQTELTRQIGLVVTDSANPFFTEVIRGAVVAANEADHTITLLDTQESLRQEEEAIQRILQSVDGLILAAPRIPDGPIRAAARERPVVLISRRMPEVPSISPNNQAGIQEALSHLSALEHRSLTYVAGPTSSYASNLRWKLLRESAPQFGIEARMLGPVQPILAGGENAARQFAARPTTSVICFNDLVALGFMRELTRMGLSVPRDVSVIGIDNIMGSELISPSLTTIAAPFAGLGSVAVNTLLNLINGSRASVQESTVLPMRLIVRHSTGLARTA